jgi:hypothetical protein
VLRERVALRECVYSVLADLKLEQGQADEAEALLLRALKLVDQDHSRPVVVAEIRYMLGRALRALGRPEDAQQQEVVAHSLLKGQQR